MRFCFVSTRRGSYFMTELLAALAAATEAAGQRAELVFDEFPPPADDRVYVVVPHEFDAWGSRSPSAEQRARAIALCTENPGTEWFEATYRLLAGFGSAVSINRSSAAELRRRGVRCEHLQLGYSPQWDVWRGNETSARAIDVLYLGAADPRRDPLVAGIGASLWSRECQFLVPPLEPRTGPRADFLIERRKHKRLAGSKLLINLHRTTSAAFEWMRFLEAICNGCVVVSEPSLDEAPLVAGEHFVQAPVTRIAAVAGELLDDPGRVLSMREQSYEFVREHLPIEPAGLRLAELAAELPRGAVVTAPPPRPVHDITAVARANGATVQLEVSEALADVSTTGPHRGTFADRLRDGLLGRLGPQRGGPRARRGVASDETPGYASAHPRVSVLGVVVEGVERACAEQLKSVVASHHEDLEIVVLVVGSGRRTGRAVSRLLAAHSAVPMKMLRAPLALSESAHHLARDANRAQRGEMQQPGASGILGAARNLLTERARGELVLALPLTGGIFPSTIERLTRALEADPGACFSYPMIAVVENGAAVELRGSLPWEPQRLARESWIDSPALIRRRHLIDLGGYSTDPRLHGLEDFDLWCRIASASLRGAHVPQVLAWHPPGESAPPRDVASLPPDVSALIRERSPGLFDAAPPA